MIFWPDAQLPPALADFLTANFDLEAIALRELGLRDAEDMVIFQKAREHNVVLISKDSDFVELIQRMGAPPKLRGSLAEMFPMRISKLYSVNYCLMR